MRSDELRDLHYIAHVRNVQSILNQGIYSHNRVNDLDHRSIADAAVQDRRRKRKLSNGRWLHDYVNLYFDARNPMLFRSCQDHDRRDIVVLEITKKVLAFQDVVVTDGNAACGSGLSGTRFYTPDQGVRTLLSDDVYCKYWTSPDVHIWQERKRKRMAEVLIPDHLDSGYIIRVLTSCEETKEMILGLDCEILVEVSEHLFFL